jgi:hypothetical protein
MAASGGRVPPVRAVLGEAWRLFIAGLPRVFPWVLAAELIPFLPFANTAGSLFDTDLSSFGEPGYLARALACGALQAALYAAAVLRLAASAGDGAKAGLLGAALRATPAVLVGYIVYEILVIIGLCIALLFFVVGVMTLGPWAAVAICFIPLAPTAIVSTALALFIFPAALERRGPFAALGESWRLARGAWVKVSLVVSVPALVLLLLWFGENSGQLVKQANAFLEAFQHAQENASFDGLQALAKTPTEQGAASVSNPWHLGWAALGAFGWWYTLATCYALYRDLKSEKA